MKWSRRLSLSWRQQLRRISILIISSHKSASCAATAPSLVSAAKTFRVVLKLAEVSKMAAFQTMNAIKRKMHKLKTDKENEYDRVDQLEQKFIELRTLNEKVNCRHRCRCVICVILPVTAPGFSAPRGHRSFWLPLFPPVLSPEK